MKRKLFLLTSMICSLTACQLSFANRSSVSVPDSANSSETSIDPSSETSSEESSSDIISSDTSSEESSNSSEQNSSSQEESPPPSPRAQHSVCFSS